MNYYKIILLSILTAIFGVFVAGIVVLIIYVNSKWAIIGTVIGIVLVDLAFGCWILLSKRDSDVKLCWLFFVLGVPIFGWLFYVFFGNNIQGAIQKKKNIRGWLYLKKYEDEKRQIDAKDVNSRIRNIYMYNEKASATSVFMNNGMEIIEDNADLYKKTIDLIRSAKKQINIITFILKDSVYFRTVCAELIKKSKEGIKVALIYDWFGAFGHVHKQTIKELKQAGIKVARFNPPNWNFINGALNFRNHQKAIIIDNDVALYGGSNISDEYLSISKEYNYFKDINYIVKGKIVSSLTIAFMHNWLYFTIYSRRYIKKIREEDNELIDYTSKHSLLSSYNSKEKNYMQLVKYLPNVTEKTVEQTIVSLITNAKKSIKLTTPYFCPPDSIVEALKTAALSGIDVEMIFPHRSDNKYFMIVNNRKECEIILRSGAKVYEYGGFNHSKYLIIDDQYVFTGSNNLDYRSLWMNFESSLLIESTNVARNLIKVFNEDKKHSIPIDVKTLSKYDSISNRTIRAVTRFFYPLI